MTLALLLHSALATGKFLASEDIILRAGCLSGLFPQIYLSHVADAALSLSKKGIVNFFGLGDYPFCFPGKLSKTLELFHS